ncbi:MAG TPA: AraC family transcriptional regulator [Bacteroidales bacterium]|nr:AraC family transcriptional regulator [Bacteroidales bacterium]
MLFISPMIKQYDFFRTKYGDELLIDLIHLQSLEKYILPSSIHTLTYYDITLITGGKGSLTIDQHTFGIHPGQLVFSSPGQVRHWKIDEMPQGLVLIFETSFLNTFLNDADFVRNLSYFHSSFVPNLMLDVEEEHHLKKLFEEIEEEIKHFDKNDKEVLRALLLQSLVWLNRVFIKRHPDERNKEFNFHVKAFETLVNEHYMQHHDITFYAARLNITQGHLNDLCKKFVGITAKQYVQNRLMLEAQRLISYSDLTVNQIADRLHFDDPSYFIKAFKSATGLTPLNYRKQKP